MVLKRDQIGRSDWLNREPATTPIQKKHLKLAKIDQKLRTRGKSNFALSPVFKTMGKRKSFCSCWVEGNVPFMGMGECFLGFVPPKMRQKIVASSQGLIVVLYICEWEKETYLELLQQTL